MTAFSIVMLGKLIFVAAVVFLFLYCCGFTSECSFSVCVVFLIIKTVHFDPLCFTTGTLTRGVIDMCLLHQVSTCWVSAISDFHFGGEKGHPQAK